MANQIQWILIYTDSFKRDHVISTHGTEYQANQAKLREAKSEKSLSYFRVEKKII